MGTPKATLDFDGLPLLEHAIRQLRGAGLAVSIAGHNHHPVEKSVPIIKDLGASQGPLGGICGALSVTSVTWSVFVPVDLPLLPSALLTRMLEVAEVTGAPIVVPSVNGFAQTFPAVIDRVVFKAFKAQLGAGDRGCFSAFQAAAGSLGKPIRVLPAEFLVQTGQVRHPEHLPAACWFFNINSPSDLSRARSFRGRIKAQQGRFA